eukprot:CAMPEP_0114234318 /NCGR_PEP_ID=MMETSP0058-20121206/5648_1 /TAXON_ID=36894 /ORGANISM="Pyramimonas parkeae, CCMP726" /LENGTH=249 /DNA_ID=CAMNT_0001345995 /DNA_START=242 /DNA_END=991 /DNA_ORIENTATION=-
MEVVTKTLTYRDGDTTLHAYMAVPSNATAPLPGVLVGHTAIGLQEEFIYDRTKAVAELGYVGFALDMFGTGYLLSDPAEIKKHMDYFKQDRMNVRRRVRAAYECLRRQFEVDATRIAGIGYCFGGRVILDLARSGLPVRGVVSFHGVLDAPTLIDHPPILAKVIAFHGYRDPFSPKDDVDAFANEMESKGVDWQLHTYGGTYHGFTRPDKTEEVHLKAGFQTNVVAERRSWATTAAFLDEVFRSSNALL